MKIDEQDVLLMLWDLAGEDSRSQVQTSYLRVRLDTSWWSTAPGPNRW